jgi:C_GCAxxG_C_C family probable redox protein
MEPNIEERATAAGQRALDFKDQGFHCSESTFLAINEALGIADPALVRLVTGFHGGGGCHRLHPGVDLKGVLAGLASGADRRTPEEAGLAVTGHLCGALAAGIVCIGLRHGRTRPEDDLVCVDELAFELHRRFLEEFGLKECRALRQKYVPLSDNHTCELIYRRGAELAVQLLLEAPALVAECPGAAT